MARRPSAVGGPAATNQPLEPREHGERRAYPLRETQNGVSMTRCCVQLVLAGALRRMAHVDDN